MDNMRFNSPRSVIFGKGVSKTVGQTLKAELNMAEVAVVTDNYLYDHGLATPVIDSLHAAGIQTHVWHDINPSPLCSTAEACYLFLRDLPVQAIVVIGGGSAIDVAKGAALLLTNPLPISQYMDNPAGIPNPAGLPIISVPTTAGTGSEVTAGLILVKDETHLKAGAAHPTATPVMSFIDPELHTTMSLEQTVATNFDTLAHALEAYVSKRKNAMGDMYSRAALKQVFPNLRKAVANLTDADIRYELALGSYLGGQSICFASCGINHALAYPLESAWHIPHGAANAALLPATVKFNLVSAPKEYKEIAEIFGIDVNGLTDEEAGLRASDAIYQLAEDVGVVRLRALGVKDEDIPTLADAAMTMDRLLSLTPRRPSRDEIMEIYRASM